MINNLLTRQLIRGASGSVSVPATPPVVTPTPPIAGTFNPPDGVVSTAYSYDVSAIFTGGAVVSYALVGTLPAGLSLNTSTGLIDGTPTTVETPVGIAVTGTNADGADTTNTADIVITAAVTVLPITSTGFTPTEGIDAFLQMIYNNSASLRGLTLEIGLFANSSGLTTASAYSELIPVTGDGYAKITLNESTDWTISGGFATTVRQLFTATGSNWTDCYGYYVATTGTPQRLKAVNVSGQIVSVPNGDSYGVEHTVQLEQGTSGITPTAVLTEMLERFYELALVGADYTIDLVDSVGTTIDATGGYLVDTLSDGSWTIAAANATYTPNPSWTATGADFNPDVGGYKITKGGVIYHTDLTGSPVTVADGDSYTVDLTVTV